VYLQTPARLFAVGRDANLCLANFGAPGLYHAVLADSCALLIRRNLAIGIGIQNFPEGLAVSLPLQAAGFSTFRSFL
jgi:hypothetical protein